MTTEARLIRKVYLKLSIVVESDADDLLDIINDVRDKVEDSTFGLNGVVTQCTWDREKALEIANREKQVIKLSNPEEKTLDSNDVAVLCERYNITLKKSMWPWRGLESKPLGHVQGLNSLYGRLILTNGILAILVRDNGYWAEVHLANFVCDEEEPKELKEARKASPVKKEPTEKVSKLKKALSFYD